MAEVPVYLVTPERLNQSPDGPFLLPDSLRPEVGQELNLTRGSYPWWEEMSRDVRTIEAVRWQLLWPHRSNEVGTMALVLTLSERRPPSL